MSGNGNGNGKGETRYIYRMRAECMIDVGRAMVALSVRHMLVKLSVARCSKVFADVEVDMVCAAPLADVLAVLATVVDGHVMVRTIAAPTLYTGEEQRSELNVVAAPPFASEGLP